MRLTAQNLVNAINQLPRKFEYNYVNPNNRGRISIVSVTAPEGPIQFKRYDPSKGGTLAKAKTETISSQMIWRLANALLPNRPVNVDRVFGGSYNTRSVLESLIAHTAQFYTCMPGRIEQIRTRKTVRPGHKHLLYCPDEPHEVGRLVAKAVEIEISEITTDVVYQSITLNAIEPDLTMSIEQRRRHAQIQIALVLIGQQLGFRTWVAANDAAVEYQGKRITQLDSVIDQLGDEQVLRAYPEAVSAARLIDCIWFRNGKLMPAVMEIEHSTGVTSGLTRMKGFYDLSPTLKNIRWVVVAPDEDREKVLKQANLAQFRDLDVKFFPYSAVEELYSLCDRRKPKGVTDEFLDCFMERCLV
jgi:hypothetical protein